MALVLSISGEEKPRKSSFRAEKRSWTLRDYLRDDVSSCSSNGFRSFPRRQCCVAVRNIIENEVIRAGRHRSKQPEGLARIRSFSSAIHRTSTSIINAIKLLPFKSPAITGAGKKNRLLPRSFPKKLFKKSFSLKKASNGGEKRLMVKEEEECDEIERWISFGVVGSEKYRPLDLSNDTTVTNASTTSNSNSDGKSDSWSDITFNSDTLTSSSENDAGERRERSPAKVTGKGVCVTVGEDSVVPAVTECIWSSPISVLDFQDNNNKGSPSPFTISAKTQVAGFGSEERELGRFESLLEVDELEAVNHESLLSTSIQSSSTPSYNISSESEEDENENQVNEVVVDIFSRENISKKGIRKLNHLDNLVLVDFFRENILVKDDNTLLKAAKDWLNGHHDMLILGWEVKEKRQAYIREMEEEGKWTRDTKTEEREAAIELGAQVLAHLIEELLVDICYSY